MLHSFVYNESFTQDLRDAIRNNDPSVFESEIVRLCEVVSNKSKDEFETNNYDADLTRLTLCLGLLDCLKRQGETVGFIMDYWNF